MSDNYQFLTHAPVHRVIGEMAIPTIISMLLTSVYNLVDTFFVGQIDTQSTAAVGIVFSVMFFIQAFSFFFGNGSGNYISRQLGAQKVEDAETMASTGLFYTLAFSILIMLTGLLFLEPVSILLGSTPTILPYTCQYLGISLLGTPFIMGTFCINNQMRFQGFAKYSVYGVVIGSIINCLLDPLFIFGFSMGVRGAALASVIGQFCGFMILLVMSRKEGVIRYSPRKISFESRFVKEIIAGGTPSLSRQGLASISTIALNSVAGNYGDAAIAAMSVVNRITMFIFSVIIGLGQGYQPMCGFCYGAKLYDRVKKGFWFSTKIGMVFLLFWAVVLIIFSKDAVALFRNDPEVIAIGIPALRYQMIMFPAGLCSRRQNGVIRDLEWKKTFIIKSIQAKRDVVPVHFGGRNSDFFYNLANVCKALGIKFNIAMLYLADEMFKNRHKTFTVTFGKPIPWQTFDKSKTPAQWAEYVKDIVYKL